MEWASCIERDMDVRRVSGRYYRSYALFVSHYLRAKIDRLTTLMRRPLQERPDVVYTHIRAYQLRQAVCSETSCKTHHLTVGWMSLGVTRLEVRDMGIIDASDWAAPALGNNNNYAVGLLHGMGRSSYARPWN